MHRANNIQRAYNGLLGLVAGLVNFLGADNCLKKTKNSVEKEKKNDIYVYAAFMYQVRIKTFEDVENNQQCGGGIWTWIRNKSYLDSFLERHVLKSVLFLFYHRNLPKRIWIFWPMLSRHSDNKLSPLCLVKKPGPHKTFWPIRTENSIVRYITTQLGLVVCSELYMVS